MGNWYPSSICLIFHFLFILLSYIPTTSFHPSCPLSHPPPLFLSSSSPQFPFRKGRASQGHQPHLAYVARTQGDLTHIKSRRGNPVGVPQEYQTVQLFHVYRGPRLHEDRHLPDWQLSLCEHPWALVCWFCEAFSCILDPSGSYHPAFFVSAGFPEFYLMFGCRSLHLLSSGAWWSLSDNGPWCHEKELLLHCLQGQEPEST